MKSFIAICFVVILAASSTAAESSDCKNGKCSMLSLPKTVVHKAEETVSSLVSKPAQALRSKLKARPVRRFVARLFR